MKDTTESFEFQWSHLPEAPYLLSDPAWRKSVAGNILEELATTREELRGKRVLDAGCGQGRWAYGFQQLGCQVLGFDSSPSGIAYAREHVAGIFDVADILDLSYLRELYAERSMDLVWCWGCIHHTPDPARAFSNLASFLKVGGKLHIYVYGKKSLLVKLIHTGFSIFSLEHRLTLAKVLSETLGGSPHSNFDAFSPGYSEHTEEEVKAWFIQNGLTYERVYPTWPWHGRPQDAGPIRSRDTFATGTRIS